MKYLLSMIILFTHALYADDGIHPAEDEQRQGVYLAQGFAFTRTNGIGFDVTSKNNEERATLAGGKAMIGSGGYAKGNFRAEFGIAWNDPEVRDIYYIKYNGQTMDLYEINEGFSINGKIKSLSYVGRVWFGIDNSTRFTPYIRGGSVEVTSSSTTT